MGARAVQPEGQRRAQHRRDARRAAPPANPLPSRLRNPALLAASLAETEPFPVDAAGPGRETLADGVRGLSLGAPTMNSLVALGAFASFSLSCVAAALPKLARARPGACPRRFPAGRRRCGGADAALRAL